jgi:hypothetical protein
MQSCIYEGRVRHRRREPVPHQFHYRLYLLYLDLAELPAALDGRWLWSARRPAWARFRRADHWGDPRQPLDGTIRALVAGETGRAPAGPIRLLTLPRTAGYCFNPISLFFCFDSPGERLEALVAEVSNTPWGERHCYVLDGGRARHGEFCFQKRLHVSPFLEMELEYALRLHGPAERLAVQLDVLRGGRRVVDATLSLARRPLNGRTMAGILARHPLITWRVTAAIYWQACRLWWKRCPFYPHPAGEPASPAAARNR